MQAGQSRLQQLYQFSPELLELGPPILDNRLEDFEKTIGFMLPDDFKYLLKAHNGFSLNGIEVYGLDAALRGSALDQIYQIEHYEVANAMPDALLPFCADGAGNHYCLDLSRYHNGRSPVVFWQHDCRYESRDDLETCQASFCEWVDEVFIGWTLEEYNYDGSPKG
ncbi:SMI1/KNR4 family protein [Larkinella insperata]|uniref:SMI1/KNR4 family protein n=1 Tax=Larkinella insperata TaxID=332158 RepID=A0ABW3QFK3_9BACT